MQKLILISLYCLFSFQVAGQNRLGAPQGERAPRRIDESLFALLLVENDSMALDAFMQLINGNPAEVVPLTVKNEKPFATPNRAIPMFPYRFIKQMVVLTDYYRRNRINSNGSEELRNDIALLKTNLSFAERYKLENKLIQTLSLTDISAFEYWALIGQRNVELTYSAGRILDVFYSRNWSKMLADKEQLATYLKKSYLFERLGIKGICNDYLKKFTGTAPTVERLRELQSTDPDINAQLVKINTKFTTAPEVLEKKDNSLKSASNDDFKVIDLEKKLKKLTANVRDSAKNEEELVILLSQINYQQLPLAFQYIEKYPFKDEKYSFMEQDFGFFMLGDLNKKENRDAFLDLYSHHTEYELYAYYLDSAGIDYKNNKGKFDYDKIYELLKFDVVTAFAGGGGSERNNEVYALIKLLELTYKTTLDFPGKLCNAKNMYSCSASRRVKAWMSYLAEHNLLEQRHVEPLSFTYEE